MPKGPGGEKRPAGVIGNAVLIGRIATGHLLGAGHCTVDALVNLQEPRGLGPS